MKYSDIKNSNHFSFRLRWNQIHSMGLGFLSVLFFLIAFFYGINKGFQNWVTEGIEYQNVNIASAITEFAYGLDLGGMAHRQVYDTLRKGGVAFYKQFLDPIGVKFPANLNNAALLNRAFQSAASIEKLSPDRTVYKGVKPVEPVDLGMAQYYEFSFRIFGLKVQSFYYFYCLILVSSIFFFFIRHFGDQFYCSILTLLAALHLFMFIYCAEFLPPEHQWGVGTVYSSRFIAILCIIPALHLVIDILKNPKFHLVHLISFSFQAVLLLWLVTVRGSVLWAQLWVYAAIFVVALSVAGTRIFRQFWDSEALLRSVYKLISWPIITFLFVTAGFSAYANVSTNPFYRFSYESLTHHMIWHSVYAGLGQHPDWHEKYGQYYKRNGHLFTGDGMPLFAAEKLLETKYGIEPDYIKSDLWGNRYRATERIIKEAYIQFIKDDPRFFLELIFIHRPVILYQAIKHNLERVLKNLPVYFYLCFFVSYLSLLTILYRFWLTVRQDMFLMLGILFVGVGGALAPVLSTFAVQLAINDQIFMLILFGSTLSLLIPLLIFEFLRSRSLNILVDVLLGRRGFGDNAI